MQVKIDDAQLNAALQVAIVNAIGETGREQIIKEAVSYLVRDTGSPGRPSSVLYRVIQDVAERIAVTILTEKFNADEDFQKNVHSLYEEATKKLFDVESKEKLVERLAQKLGEAFRERW